MVLRHAGDLGATGSARSPLTAASAVDVAPAGEMTEKSSTITRGNSLHEHHHGHDERAEART